ncbi:MAG: META domain-containing protein [Candidatus Marinimicrobia bacterium]|nr:META domain-containing protein [Candidatus Neomarinimicrobiota bacterium]
MKRIQNIYIILLFTFLFISCEDYSDNLTDKIWTLQSFEPNGEGKTPVNKDEVYNLEFFDDSTLVGIMDCNHYDGIYYIFGEDSLNIYNNGITYVYCGKESKFNYYFKAIHSVVTYQIRNNRLILFYDGGKSKLNYR